MPTTWAQSPHGKNFKIDCAQCHNPGGWNVDYETIAFDHSTTNFTLEGSHKDTDCKSCHTSMVFKEVPTDCIACHTDVHEQSLGNDCVRCHTQQNWLVFNIPEVHESNGFPLIGVHSDVSCIECHQGESGLVFNRLGNECIECHQADYVATTNPEHVTAGFSTNCAECHTTTGIGWDSSGFIHDFFPLNSGHDINDCTACHSNQDFSDTPTECVACHLDDYNSTTNPNHQTVGFPTDCASCHTTNPNWMPATFNHDGLYFPIYSGRHEGEWNACTDCHTNINDYSIFTCVTCHTQNDTNDEHEDVVGYVYESNACLQCHPDGSD